MATRILLADDNLAVLASVRTFLVRHGFEVAGEACDGQRAVDLALSLRPDVVVLDCSMPQKSGLEAAREICTAGHGVRVVLLTQHCAEHLIITAFRAGVRGYVAKSDTADDLVRAIREVSRGRIFLSHLACSAILEAYLPKATD